MMRQTIKSKLEMMSRGEVPEGYKASKIGIIPEDWVIKKIEEISNVNPTKDKVDEDIEVSFIGMSDISVDGKLQNYNIKKYGEVCKGFTSFKDNDVLLAKITPCFENGKGGLVQNLKNGIGFGSTEFHVLRANKKDDAKFIYYTTKSWKFKTLGEKNMTGSAGQKRVPTDFISKFKLAVPALDKERNEISKILSDVDNYIDRKEMLIAVKEKYKIGLVQNLLTGKISCKEDKLENNKNSSWGKIPFNWEERSIDYILESVVREVEKPKDSYCRLGLRSHAKGTFHELVEDPSTVSMDKLYIVKNKDLIVNITFAWEHAIALAKEEDDGKLVSHRFPTYEFKNNAIPEFYEYFVKQPKFKYMLGNISPGGAGRNRVMSKTDFMKLKVLVPPIEEQKSIVEILSTVDKEIELLEKELEKIKEQKKGLMQLLLTGKVRVNEINKID